MTKIKVDMNSIREKYPEFSAINDKILKQNFAYHSYLLDMRLHLDEATPPERFNILIKIINICLPELTFKTVFMGIHKNLIIIKNFQEYTHEEFIVYHGFLYNLLLLLYIIYYQHCKNNITSSNKDLLGIPLSVQVLNANWIPEQFKSNLKNLFCNNCIEFIDYKF